MHAVRCILGTPAPPPKVEEVPTPKTIEKNPPPSPPPIPISEKENVSPSTEEDATPPNVPVETPETTEKEGEHTPEEVAQKEKIALQQKAVRNQFRLLEFPHVC